MDDAEEGSRATRREVLGATAGALAVGALPGRSTAQQASGPTVYVGSADDTLYAVDAATGTQEWAFTQPSNSVYSSPTVVDGTVYIGSWDEMLSMSDIRENLLDVRDNVDDKETDGGDTGTTEPEDDGMPMRFIAWGAVGALGLIYGGYRLLGSDDQTADKNPEPTTTPETTAETLTTTDSRREGETKEKLREIRALVEDVKSALSSADTRPPSRKPTKPRTKHNNSHEK